MRRRRLFGEGEGERGVRIEREVGVDCMGDTCDAVAHCGNHSNVVRRELMDGMCWGVGVGGAGEGRKRGGQSRVFGANG
jgi:hypothetical protein